MSLPAPHGETVLFLTIFYTYSIAHFYFFVYNKYPKRHKKTIALPKQEYAMQKIKKIAFLLSVMLCITACGK